ncbi:MAG: class I SAM-dependent methyltransferase [Planctomycetales bacterium]|nr:class I SAM-dependent methyltransferase [Planctomycetales bacterium]
MSQADRDKWDEKYAKQTAPDAPIPDDWMTQHVASLAPGRALELACGLGHNAMWLADHGWQVDAVDVSTVGLASAAKLAGRLGQHVNWIAADLDDFTPAAAAYDLVVIFRYLDRARLPSLVRTALRPGGWLVYETYSQAQLARPGSHIRNPAFTLSEGELPRLFASLEVIAYAEVELPDRSVVRLFARNPD